MIVVKNRVRDYRGRRVAIVSIDHHVDGHSLQYLKALAKGGSESACVSTPMKSGPSMLWCCDRGKSPV